MHLEGQFAKNAETVEGDGVHRRVDGKTDELLATKQASQPSTLFDLTEPSEFEVVPAEPTGLQRVEYEFEKPEATDDLRHGKESTV